MKNLFKNLMLVAVAAMAFTACTETNDEVNAVSKKTVINGVVVIDNDDTRSGFVGSTTDEEGKVTYHSAWDGGENIKLFINYGAAETTATIDAEGKFTAEFEGDYAESCIITACSPAEAWDGEYSFTIPAEQTPRANSVDPAAHILKAQAVSVTNGSAEFKMQHEVSYGKMTVNTPENFEIAKVVINLKGEWYGYEKDLTYTLNATNVENNTFWFAADAIEVSEMTVTAYDAEDKAYTKSVTMGEDKVLKFQYYKVSTFSVSNLEECVAPAVPAFTSAYADGASSYYDFYIYFEDNSNKLSTLKLNPYYIADSDLTLAPGTYKIGGSSGDFYNGSYSTYGGTELYSGTINISVVDKQYHFEFINISGGSNVVLEHATYTGPVVGLNVPDARTALAAPNATATVESKKITISWDAVDNAEGYRVKLYSPYDEYFEEVITDTEYVYDAQLWSTMYSFTVASYASDENPTYKSSVDAYVDIKTEKDPNQLADVVANNIVWDSSNSAFKMTGEVVSGTAWGHSSDYVRLYINESDRPGNNSIKVGTYTGCGGMYPSVGQFGARIYLYWGDLSIYSGNFGSSSTLEVAYDEAVGYTIILTHNGTTYGYKGMPDGWVAPSEDDDNNGEGGDETDDTQYGDGTQTNTYIYTCDVVKSGGYYRLTFSCPASGAKGLYLESNNDVASDFKVGTITQGNNWYPSACKYANGTITTTWDESTISFTKISDTIYSFDEIKISTFDGYVYYKCESVNLY